MQKVMFVFLMLIFSFDVSASANCSQASLDRDLGMATDLSATTLQRLERMKLIYSDIRQLRAQEANPKELPVSFYRRCREIKDRAFTLNAQNAHGGLSERADFHALVGDYFALQGRRQDALSSYDNAINQDPDNAEYKLKAFELYQNIEADRIRSLNSKTERVRATESFIQKVLERIDAIINTKQATSRIKSQANVYKALALSADNRFSEAEQAWIQALKDLPSNSIALNQLSKFYVNKLERPDKAIPHLQRLCREQPTEDNFKFWLQTAYSIKNSDEVLSAANAGLQKNPSNNVFKAYKAWALLKMERTEEAKKLSQDFSNIAGDNTILREVKAQLYAIEASTLASNRPGEAITAIKAAIKLFPNSEEYRTQLASIIVDHAKKNNFNPRETTKKDFDYAIGSMSQILVKKELANNVAEIGTTLYAFSSNPAMGKGLCEKLSKFQLETENHLINCAYIYKASRMDSKARKLLDIGLEDPRFKTQRERFLRAVNDIGI